jgi:hypothetical protein
MQVLRGREEIFGRLHAVGEIAAPAATGLPTGGSRRAALHGAAAGPSCAD